MTDLPLPSRPEPERETPGLLVSPWDDALPPVDDTHGAFVNEDRQRESAALLAHNVELGLELDARPATPRSPDVPPRTPVRRMTAAQRAAIVAGTAGTPREDPDA